jgi:hypothetical protein
MSDKIIIMNLEKETKNKVRYASEDGAADGYIMKLVLPTPYPEFVMLTIPMGDSNERSGD